jgi:hypothetical protein
VRILIVVLIAVIAGYFIYQEVFVGGDDGPSCKQVFESCSTKCRKTETEPTTYTACLKKCKGALEECK